MFTNTEVLFAGIGPAVKSSPDDVVTESFCVMKPICLRFRLTVSGSEKRSDSKQKQLMTRAVGIIINPATNESLAILAEDDISAKLCLSICPADSPYNSILQKCAPCGIGFYADAVTNSCRPCRSGTSSYEEV